MTVLVELAAVMLVAWGGAAFLVWYLRRCLRRGVTRRTAVFDSGNVRRADDPVGYWVTIAHYALVATVLVIGAIYFTMLIPRALGPDCREANSFACLLR